MRVVAIVQARMESTRLPNKVLAKIGKSPMIELLLSRLSKAREVNEIIMATSTNDSNQPLVNIVNKLGYKSVRGSENDVLERYLAAAHQVKADVIVRITGDCPIIDPLLVDRAVKKFKDSEVDYFSNIAPPTYPDGLDIEVFSLATLERSCKETQNPFDREHVTPYMRRKSIFVKDSMVHSEDLSSMRWTVDEPADLEVIRNIFSHFQPNIYFSWDEVVALERTNPDIFVPNHNIKRNEGSTIGSGQKLWGRAKKVIQGGNMLLSKRPEMFLPDQWPAYFSKAKGCLVWDLDGNQFVDMSIMGIGTNILGYGDTEVDDAVRNVINQGNMSTLNCPEEVYLAERLIEIHPWADMAKFARSGGEANAVAIRIARAASGRDNVAICGYHGWHDWYLSVNLGDNNGLDGHLLPGLDPIGVPRSLKDTVFPFSYNNIEELTHIVETHEIGVIKMEVSRNQGPENNFLQKVRDLATSKNIVLIFDECTSGFRQCFGGLHKIYGVNPDIAMFGKALGNGYAITSIIGRREVMEVAQTSFISSTFWTERIGPVAALKTLDVMESTNSWQKITEIGNFVRSSWVDLAKKYDLEIDLFGLPSLSGFNFRGEHALKFKTLITQEMLAKGYLASNSLYVCTAHTPEIISGYLKALEEVFELIKACEGELDINSLLKGPVCHGGFKRLN